MATTVGNNRADSGFRLRFRGKLMTAIAIVASVFALVQSGIVQPASLLERIPHQYVRDSLERYLPTPPHAFLPGAYLYQQERPLSCEYASTTIAATLGGWNISEYDFDAVVPLNENPHLGYRGNIWGEWGNTMDYGLYPEPLHQALSSWGIPSQVIYAHGDADVLRKELQEGRAVVMWLAMRGTVNSFDVESADGSTYQLTQYMHVMTAYGIDETGVYLTDPGTAVWRHYTWETFMQMWNVMDGMTLSVHPNTSAQLPDSATALHGYVWRLD